MEQENKRCVRCGSFSAYYTMGFCCLLRENNGYCSLHKKVMAKCDGCDKWHCRYSSKERRIKVAVNSISEIYKKIALVEQMLQEVSERKEPSEGSH